MIYESNTNTLQHHGVKGMKWGVRRARPKYVTVRQAYNNARQKEQDARRNALQDAKSQGMTVRNAFKSMNKAGQAAKRQSIYDDQAYNQQMRRDYSYSQAKGGTYAKSWISRNGTAIAKTIVATAVAAGITSGIVRRQFKKWRKVV